MRSQQKENRSLSKAPGPGTLVGVLGDTTELAPFESRARPCTAGEIGSGGPGSEPIHLAEARGILRPLHAQLAHGFFSVPGLSEETAGSRESVLRVLSELAEQGAIERLRFTPYLRITPAGDRLLTS